RASDRWVFVAARSRDELTRGVADVDLETAFRREPAHVWVERLTSIGIGAHVLNTPEEAMHDPWARAHGVSREVHFPEAGDGMIVGPAPRLSATPMCATEPPPPPGWHAQQILTDLG